MKQKLLCETVHKYYSLNKNTTEGRNEGNFIKSVFRRIDNLIQNHGTIVNGLIYRNTDKSPGRVPSPALFQ